MLNKTIKGSDFDNIFTEVIHSESLGLINPEQLRLFHLNVMNNEFVSDDLQAFIRKNVGRYVFSRAKLEQFKINDDLESIGLEAMAVMQKNGRPGQQNTGNSLGGNPAVCVPGTDTGCTQNHEQGRVVFHNEYPKQQM